MLIEIGYFALCFAFLLALYACVTSVISLFKPHIALIESARHSIIGCFFCILLSCVAMWHAIIFHDFSVKYVFEHSAVDMPPIYLFTSFWSALEGSHLLWTFLLTTVCAIAVLSRGSVQSSRGSVQSSRGYVQSSRGLTAGSRLDPAVKPRDDTAMRDDLTVNYLPSIYLAFSVCLLFMLGLNLTVSRPFDHTFPTNQFGLGMNALLQNPYMAIHPPMLFLGYSLLIVPFAYGFAALLKGAITPAWLLMVRRFALIAWTVLTVAIFLGGKWAYVVLGWGGYWGWDPVENASFMPWLATTAFLHTTLIYERTKKLPRLAIFLGMFAFILTFFGTFLTRSGVISSVHSFAESSIGPSYLLWIVFLCVITVFLVFTRGHLLQEKQSFEPFQFSKEAILLFTNYFLLFLLAIVFFGTVLPLIVESLSGTKISIQQPFYNAFAPWIGLILVSILGIGNLAKWKSARIENPWLSIFLPLCVAFICALLFYYIKHLSFKSCFIYLLVIWTIFVLIADFIYKFKRIDWNAFTFLKHHRSYFGALIIHIGFLTAILGFSGYSQTKSHEINLPLNQSTEFQGFMLTNKGLSFSQQYNESRLTALIETRNKRTNDVFVIEPARTKFTNNEQWFNEVGVHSTQWFDLYLVLMSFDTEDQSVVLKISYNPMVKFVWTSVVVMVFGALMALSSRFSFQLPSRGLKALCRSAKARGSRGLTAGSSKMFSAILIFFVISITLFGLSGIAYAAQQTPPTVEEIGRDLRCPTCLGMSIMESETPQSIAMREEVQHLLDEGKNKKEIINYFKEHYGSWILREPDSSTWFGKLLWGIPLFGFIVGPFLILWRLK